MPKKHLDREDRLERHYRRLGTRDPMCVTCGKRDLDHPEIFELHHIGKRSHDDVAIECANCHRQLSERQKDHLVHGPSRPIGKMETIGHFLLGLADMLAMIVETLKAFGTWLLGQSPRRVMA